MIELISFVDNFICLDNFVVFVNESEFPIKKEKNAKKKQQHEIKIKKKTNRSYVSEMRQETEVVLLVIEGNSLEKNPAEKETMPKENCLMLRKSKLTDRLMVEIVEKMHDEENQHRIQVTPMYRVNQTKLFK